MELMSQNYATLVPAYGWDYKSGKEAEEAFNRGEDFILQAYNQPAKPINKSQIKPGITVNLRFKKLTGVKPVKVKA